MLRVLPFLAAVSCAADSGVCQGEHCMVQLPRGQMASMWATPLFQTNVKHLVTAAGNDELVRLALEGFAAFSDAEDAPEAAKTSSAQGANERYFRWQREQHEQAAPWALTESEHWLQLRRVMRTAATAFLHGAGALSEPEQTLAGADMLAWAGVHQPGMGHLPHVHKGSVVSGVYYARVPEGSGDIVFEDPRGPLPPFDNRVIVSPREGDIVVFPSWLAHHVTATHGSEHRVAFPFNIEGAWEETANSEMRVW